MKIAPSAENVHRAILALTTKMTPRKPFVWDVRLDYMLTLII